MGGDLAERFRGPRDLPEVAWPVVQDLGDADHAAVADQGDAEERAGVPALEAVTMRLRQARVVDGRDDLRPARDDDGVRERTFDQRGRPFSRLLRSGRTAS